MISGTSFDHRCVAAMIDGPIGHASVIEDMSPSVNDRSKKNFCLGPTNFFWQTIIERSATAIDPACMRWRFFISQRVLIFF